MGNGTGTDMEMVLAVDEAARPAIALALAEALVAGGAGEAGEVEHEFLGVHHHLLLYEGLAAARAGTPEHAAKKEEKNIEKKNIQHQNTPKHATKRRKNGQHPEHPQKKTRQNTVIKSR